jgi:hypothetical protein
MLEMRQRVCDRLSRKLTLQMELRLESPCRKQLRAYTSNTVARYFGKKKRSAAGTSGSRGCLQNEIDCVAARYGHILRFVQAYGIRPAMCGLTVIAMAKVLRHWLASDLELNAAAVASQ